MQPIFISRQALPILVHKSENTQSYCVIVPTYNNENTLKDVLTKVQAICADVIVVNDGSTDSTQDIIDAKAYLQQFVDTLGPLT